MRRTLAALALTTLLAGCGGGADEPAGTTDGATDTAPTGTSSTSTDPGVATAPVPGAEGQLPADAAAMLAPYGISGKGVKESIVALDQLDQKRPLDVMGSVRMDEVVFSKDGREVAVPVPGDEAYVSVAPYVDQTHECAYHALGGCQGELVGEDVHVKITDADGTVLVDEDATTYTNGFVGYWLPKGTTGTVEMTQGDVTGSTGFDTTDQGLTCITTLQLS